MNDQAMTAADDSVPSMDQAGGLEEGLCGGLQERHRHDGKG